MTASRVPGGERCTALVLRHGYWSSRRCSRRATVHLTETIRYCAQHAKARGTDTLTDPERTTA